MGPKRNGNPDQTKVSSKKSFSDTPYPTAPTFLVAPAAPTPLTPPAASDEGGTARHVALLQSGYTSS